AARGTAWMPAVPMACGGGERRAHPGRRRACRAPRLPDGARGHEPDAASRSGARRAGTGRGGTQGPAVTRVTPLWVKICGLRTAAAIEVAAAEGASAVGFVFHDASPRNLALTAARELQRAVPAGVERVAVFL